MAFRAAASAPTIIAKLLRQHATHHHHPNSLATAPFALACRRFCSGPPSRHSPFHDDHDDPNPFLRLGELGPCRVDKGKNDYHMRIDVPGVAEEDLKLWVESGSIYFCASDTKLPHYNYDGRVFGGSISFNPDRFDSNGVKAEVKNGVLWLSVPRMKKEE